MAKKKPEWTILINGEQETIAKGDEKRIEHPYPESDDGKRHKLKIGSVRFELETATRTILFQILPRTGADANLKARNIEELRWEDESFYVRFKNGTAYKGENNMSCRPEEEWSDRSDKLSDPAWDFEDTWDTKHFVDVQTLQIQHFRSEPKSYEFDRVDPRQADTDGRFLKWVYFCEGLEIHITPRQESQDPQIDPDHHPLRVMENPCEPKGFPDRVGADHRLDGKKSWYLARCTDGKVLVVYPPQIRSAPAAARDRGTDNMETYGCLTVWGDFQYVMCKKKQYDLRDATQARETLLFLCTEGVIGPSGGETKDAILQHVTTRANDWRPVHGFNCMRLRQLYADAIHYDRFQKSYSINS